MKSSKSFQDVLSILAVDKVTKEQLAEQVHQAAMFSLRQNLTHGQNTPALQLVNSLGRKAAAKDLKRWFTVFGKFKLNKKEELKYCQRSDISPDGINEWLERAQGTPYWSLKPENVVSVLPGTYGAKKNIHPTRYEPINMTKGAITDYQAKYFAHELTRRYASNNSQKLATALMDAQVDLNPHQVEAALFAFKSPFSKGAILADEVGLGKTIEAGLVLSQKWAEGKRQILIIAPSSLRKQWVQELHDKFFLPTAILEAKSYNEARKARLRNPFEMPASSPSLVICSYQFAANKADDLMTVPWDLVVIDEAHRLRNVYKTSNKIGKALKAALSNAPKLLLTATPLQNSLMELYGLVSIIDDYAFGDAKSFRTRYARVTDGVFDDLKARLAPLCHRTLRRQVLEYIRYTNRIPLTQEFVPTEDEQALYDMVSDYLRRPNLQALPSSQRKLMILVMRKLLASSTFAIAGALDSLVRKLEGQLKKDQQRNERLSVQLGEAFAEDMETFDELAEEWNGEDREKEMDKPLTQNDIDAIQAEIGDLKVFRELAVSITENAKGTALLSALEAGFAKARELGSAEKVILFTESRRTQEYLVRLLSKRGYEGQLVLFNGSNADPQSSAIYKAWVETHKGSDRISGSRTADMRQALVDHFRNTAKIMIATEAAAEGINLQFCSMVVNYDLPWNPQRIEQRIGRCHRYGQQHDVVVVNFLNKNNAADQRVYELLAEKFSLFSGVFGASDEVLGAIESGVDFEKRIVDIYQNCRTPEAIESEFAQLRADMDAEIDVTMKDTRQKLLENFDADVHDRLRINLEESKYYINQQEQTLWKLTQHELRDHARFDQSELNFVLQHRPAGCPDIPDGPYHLGRNFGDAHRYRLGHPLAQHVVTAASERVLPDALVMFDYTRWGIQAEVLKPLIGKSGVLVLHKIVVSGADAEDHLIFAGLADDGSLLTDEQARRLMTLPANQESGHPVELPTKVSKTIEAEMSKILHGISERQAVWFDEEMEKLDKWADDKRTNLKMNLRDLDDELKELKKNIRQASNLPDKIALQRKAKQLETKRDEAWRDYDDGAREIERLKDDLIDRVEARLAQEVEEIEIFSIRWGVM